MLEHVTEILLGIAIGLPAGWVMRGMRYARSASVDAHEARRKVDKMIDERDDDGRTTFNTVAMAVVVTLALVSTIVSGYAARESDEASDRTESVAQCNQNILERTIKALNMRTAFSDEQADARRDVLVTQSDLVDALLDPEASALTQIKLTREYQEAVKTQLRLDDRNDDRRAKYPYPSTDEIRECE